MIIPQCVASTVTRSSRNSARGLTLVEIMVSMVIGLILVIGATTLYVNSRKSADVDDATARLQEVARYAMSVIESDTRMANYWGLIKDGASISNKPSQTGSNAAGLITSTAALICGATHAIDVELAVTGTNNSYPFSGSCAAFSGAAAAAADTLTIRHASASTSAPAVNKLHICSTRVAGEIMRNTACGGGELHDLVVNSYYIGTQSTGTTTVPSLRRKSLGAADPPNEATQPGFRDVEIIPGVEDMQVQFGWEPDVGGSAVRYVNPGDALLATGQVVSVRIWLLVRAEAADPSFADRRAYQYADRASFTPNDNFRRLLVSRTIFIRNAAGT
jgi:type IV pilus assembly protein PilW